MDRISADGGCGRENTDGESADGKMRIEKCGWKKVLKKYGKKYKNNKN